MDGKHFHVFLLAAGAYFAAKLVLSILTGWFSINLTTLLSGTTSSAA